MWRRGLLVVTSLATIGLATWCLLPDTVIASKTDRDEGVYLMTARLIHRGYDTRTFFFDQFYFFPKTLAAAFALFGDSLFVGRLTVFAFALAGLAGIGALSYQLGTKWVGVLAAILICAIDPLYIEQSRIVMADVPAMTCIVWSLVFVCLFQKSRRRLWLALSGLFGGASLIIKPFAVGFVVTIIVVLFSQRMRRENGRLKLDRAIWGDLLIVAAVAVAVAAPFVDFLHLVNEYRRTVGFHLYERNWRVDNRWSGLLGFGGLNLPLLAFAISGIAALRPLSISMLALLGGTLATTGILLQMPPWLHHYLLILPPLLIFSVLGFDRGFASFKQFVAELRSGRRLRSANNWTGLLFAGAVLISLIHLPWLFYFDRRARFPQPFHLDEIVRYEEQHFRPDEYLLSDDALIPYLADRLIPPPAINLTFAGVLKFDPMSFPRFEQMIREYNVAGIIVTNRYAEDPRLMSWLAINFPISTEIGANHPDEVTARIYTPNKQGR